MGFFAFIDPYSSQSICKEGPFPVCGMMGRFGGDEEVINPI